MGLIIAVPALTMISGESHSGSTLPSYVTITSSNVSQLSSVPAPKRSTYSNTGTGRRVSVGNALPARVDGDDNMETGPTSLAQQALLAEFEAGGYACQRFARFLIALGFGT